MGGLEPKADCAQYEAIDNIIERLSERLLDDMYDAANAQNPEDWKLEWHTEQSGGMVKTTFLLKPKEE